MRIVDIRERAIPLKSEIRNSSFDFTEMTTSVVAVLTDVVRDVAGADASRARHKAAMLDELLDGALL